MADHRIAVLLVMLSVMQGTSATKSTVGDYFESTSTYPANGRGVFLFGSSRVPAGVVYKFSAYIAHRAPLWLQIWRLKGGDEYTLIGQVRLNPQNVHRKYEVSLGPSNYIFTQDGDILGIYNEETTCPIAYRFTTASVTSLMYHSTEEGVSMKVGDSFSMQQINMPYQFSVTVSHDTDVAPYLNQSPGNPIDSTTQQSTTTIASIANIPPAIGSTYYAGNGLHGKVSSISQSARGLYLLPHIKLPAAVVVSFYAYFVRSDPICFQVLRLVSGEETFEVVGQVCHTPQNTPALQEVKLGAGQYIFTEEGDQIGYLNQAYTGSIGFTFLASPFQQGPWSSNRIEGEVPQLWDRITFGQSWLPYDFAIGLRYDTVIDHNKYGFPPVRPATTPAPTTTTSTTVAPTTASFPVISEPVVGMEYLQRADKYISSAARRTFLMTELCFPADGLITSFLFFPLNPGVVQLQVWRPISSSSSAQYQLVGAKRVEVNDVGLFQQVAVDEAGTFQVHRGDCLGFSTMNDRGVIGYVFQEVKLSLAEQYLGLQDGAVLAFDSIPFPYKFSLAATYKALPPTTSEHPSSAAATDASSSASSSAASPAATSATATQTAATQTDATPTAKATTTAKERAEAVSDNEDGPEWLRDSRFLLALFIWLIVLSVLFLSLCCYVACCRGKQEREAIREAQRNSYMYGYPEILRNDSTKSANSNYRRYGALNGREIIDYFNPTMESQPGIRRDDSMKRPLTRESSGASSHNGYGNSVNNVNGNQVPKTVEVYAVSSHTQM